MEGMLKSKEKRYEFIRFCVVGVVASGLHYGVYYLLQTRINVNVAYTVGYLISLIVISFSLRILLSIVHLLSGRPWVSEEVI